MDTNNEDGGAMFSNGALSSTADIKDDDNFRREHDMVRMMRMMSRFVDAYVLAVVS